MKYKSTKVKKIAITLLVIFCYSNIIAPSVALALTSGPAQPETQGFQPAGVSDMVDLQTGDFKYNIPLLDIDGYPINLNYASGTTMDDEASWVGLGWSLNPGAINRQVRGLPDDFAGDDVVTSHWTKPMVTIGGRLTTKVELFGKNVPKPPVGTTPGKVSLNGSLSFGVYKNNYTGIGGEFSVNAGVSLSLSNSTSLTGGLGVSSDTQRGADFSPNVSLSIGDDINKKTTASAGLSASLGYNTRSGLKALTLGASFSTERMTQKQIDNNAKIGDGAGLDNGASYSFNTEPVNPQIQIPYKSTSSTFSLDAGGTLFGVFVGAGLTGYKNKREVLTPDMTHPGYGFLYAERGKNDADAMMDFIREKENPVVPELPNLAIPIHTPDVFSFSSQTGGGQFRLYRGGTGEFFDSQADDESDNTSMGADFGLGPSGYHGGVTYYNQTIHNSTHKWTGDNNYLNKGDFQDESHTDPARQHVFFRLAGEKNLEDINMTNALQGTDAVKLDINSDKQAISRFYSKSSNTPADVTNQIAKTSRQPSKASISYLTAYEARHHAVDTNINSYAVNELDQNGGFTPPSADPQPEHTYDRVDPTPTGGSPTAASIVHKGHHISEVTVTDGEGKRMVYGIPVYNTRQDEYSFALGRQIPPNSNQGDYSITRKNQTDNYDVDPSTGRLGSGKGIDNYYHKESKPPYATSYLLTSILSPDYVDKTGDGITNDDLGTAIKFNYSKMPLPFKWRAPYQGAIVNRGLLADCDDDKGSIVYGEKELWYISSIESKTKIAYFITKERNDAIGVDDWLHGGLPANFTNVQKQRYLAEIRLYSKADLHRPIKIVKFEYAYELCPNIPNYYRNPSKTTVPENTVTPAKLTLKKVWFEYGNTTKGSNFPYTFEYQASTANNPIQGYDYMSTDRWGTFKDPNENPLALQNDEYPYTNQIKTTTDINVAAWHLSKINLPTGGVINVNYEADDYTYVQNRKAMNMCKIDALTDVNGGDIPETAGTGTGLAYAGGISLTLPTLPGTTNPDEILAWFKNNYLDGSDYMYTKLYVDIAQDNHNYTNPPGELWDSDFVPCYAKVQKVIIMGGHAKVIFEPMQEGDVTANPIAIAAWQKLKNDYPRWAYPGFQTYAAEDQSSGLWGAIHAIITAAGNVSELFRSLYQTAQSNNFASHVYLDKSFVRMALNSNNQSTLLSKIGGGARVKQISIDDQWQSMSGNIIPTGVGTYGQSYDYTTTDNGQKISSGVATYEPAIGSDENPFKQPVPYIESIKGAINNYFDLEEPFGESVFPAPSVTYSKVTVTDLDGGQQATSTPKTGYIVNEFYTSKDFPVRVTALPISTVHIKPLNYATFVKTTSEDDLIMSQGYSIELNDMSGKQRAIRVYNQSGAQISATEYYYKSIDIGGGEYKLDNLVKVVDHTGTVSDGIMGRDIEMFTDMREQESKNSGLNVNLGFDGITAFVIPLFLPHFPADVNNDYRLFRSACAFKVIQSYGILDKVIKTDNGSSITTQNVAFDALTGDAVVTKTQNEFNNDIYSVNIPAYWAYPGMSGAWQNLGVILSNLQTDGNGMLISNPLYNATIQSGDELDDINSFSRYWIVNEAGNKYLIDKFGLVQTNYNADNSKLLKIVRSGNRNLLSSGLTNIVCLNNPIGSDNRLMLTSNADLTQSLKVINASAATYDENWVVESPDYHAIEETNYNFSISNQNPAYESDGTIQDVGYGLYQPNEYMYSWQAAIPYWYTFYSTDGSFTYIVDNYYLASDFVPGHDVVVDGVANGYYYGANYPYPDNSYFGIQGDGEYSYNEFHYYHNNNYAAGVGAIDFNTGWGGTYPAGYLTRRLDNCGVQPYYNLNLPASTYTNPPVIHIAEDFNVPATGTYLIGYGSTSDMYFNIDRCDQGHLYPGVNSHPLGDGHYNWAFTQDPITLTAGRHTIYFEIHGSTNPHGGSSPIFGVEIYQYSGDNYHFNGTPNIIYNTRSLSDSSHLRVYFTDADPLHQNTISSRFHYDDAFNTPVASCITPPSSINPYLFGMLGNWRPYQTKVYQQSRANNGLTNAIVDVKNAGYINGFYSNWYWSGASTWVQNTDPNSRWTVANTVTLYDKYGQQLENMDALRRYSAAKFDFNGELPSAVASNAMNRDIYANSFEDNAFTAGNSIYAKYNPINDFLSISGDRLSPPQGPSTVSHSGNHAAVIPDNGVMLSTIINNVAPKSQPYFKIDNSHQYIKNNDMPGIYPNGFQPSGGKQYLFNTWIKDNNPNDKSVNISLSVNDNPVTLKCKAVVEGWKLIEGVIDLSSSTSTGTPLRINIMPNASNIYIDDMRIHPNDAHMKTYAYDDKTMRLMAELDENCFATFYEYDNEGLLVRVKKETERGVMTLKESRSSYKKHL